MQRRIISFRVTPGVRTIPLALARRLLLLVTGLALGAAAFALPAQDLPGATDFAVAGTVLNAATGQPVGRAEVFLDGIQAQLTGGDGSFSFEHIRGGGHLLSIRKPGYQGFGGSGMGGEGFAGGGFHRPGERPPGPPRRILVGPEMPALTFRLMPLASISGHLTLSTADPAEDIRVSLFRRELQNGRARWSMIDQVKTRSDGSWRVADLPAGHYLVQSSALIDGPNDPENSAVPVYGFPALYYPGVTDGGSAGELILKPGQQAQADMTLVRQRFFPVIIAVEGAPETPTSFEIADASGHSMGLPVHYDPRIGMAHANVPNGSWILIARAFGQTMRFGRADFQVAGAPVSLAVSVAPVPSITIDVTHDFATASDNSLWGPGNLSLVGADGFAAEGGLRWLQSREAGNEAEYAISIVQPGRFWVNTFNPASAYVASITSGGSDLAATPLTVTPGTQPAPIEITLRNDFGTIAGKVDLASPGASGGAGEQPQVWIYAIPLFPTTGRLPEAALQDNGQFSFGDLAPGSYRVIACDAPQEIDFHAQQGLAAWSGLGQVVTVDPNGTATAEVTVIHGSGSE